MVPVMVLIWQLIGSVPREHVGNGAQQDSAIECERPVVDVLHVQLHPGFEIERVAAADGPQAGEAGTHAQPAALPPLVLFHFVRNGRARAHQRHVALQHVPQLRPFVDRELAQAAADGGQPRIVGNLESRLSRLRCATRGFSSSAFWHMERNL